VNKKNCEHPIAKKSSGGNRNLFKPGGLEHAGALLRHYARRRPVSTR
jgi:hypothetical protein